MTTAEKFKLGLWIVSGVIFVAMVVGTVWALLHPDAPPASEPTAPARSVGLR